MLYVISGVDPNLDKFGWYDENISSKMVPNIDPKNSNVFFFPNLDEKQDLGSWQQQNCSWMVRFSMRFDIWVMSSWKRLLKNHPNIRKTWNQYQYKGWKLPPDRQFCQGRIANQTEGSRHWVHVIFRKTFHQIWDCPVPFPEQKTTLVWRVVSRGAIPKNPCFLPLNTMKCLIWEIIQLLFIHLKPCHAVFDVKFDHLVIDLARNNLNELSPIIPNAVSQIITFWFEEAIQLVSNPLQL